MAPIGPVWAGPYSSAAVCEALSEAAIKCGIFERRAALELCPRAAQTANTKSIYVFNFEVGAPPSPPGKSATTAASRGNSLLVNTCFFRLF